LRGLSWSPDVADLLLIVYIGVIGVAAGVLLVAIEAFETTVAWPGCSRFSL
jgi:hypothetical protein